MTPICGKRARPLDERRLDLANVAELARVLDERLRAVTAFGSCPTCHEAEARAFLGQLREILDRDAEL